MSSSSRRRGGSGQGDGGRGSGKVPNYVTAPAPAFKFKVTGGARAVAAYEEVVRAWRAGVIEDFYYGTRADDDDSIVWRVDGVELLATEYGKVHEIIAAACAAAGVTDIAWGPFWCGYRSLVVRFAAGLIVTQEYDGAHVVERTSEATATEVAA